MQGYYLLPVEVELRRKAEDDRGVGSSIRRRRRLLFSFEQDLMLAIVVSTVHHNPKPTAALVVGNNKQGPVRCFIVVAYMQSPCQFRPALPTSILKSTTFGLNAAAGI